MPQNGIFENQNLWMKAGKGASYSCYRGVADLIKLMAGSLERILSYIHSMNRILAGGNALKVLGVTRSVNGAVRVV